MYQLNEGKQLKDFKFSKEFIISDLSNPYFVHGFAAKINIGSMKRKSNYCYFSCKIYEQEFLAAIISNNFCATQFHPELSGIVWRKFLKRFFI